MSAKIANLYDDLLNKLKVANAKSNTGDKKEIYMAVRDVSETSVSLFNELSDFINSSSVKDLNNAGLNYSDIPNLLYLTLYSIYTINTLCNGYFSEDGRSENVYELSKIVMEKDGFLLKYGYKNSWTQNKVVLNKGAIDGLRRVHKTLVQGLVRCMCETLYNNYYDVSVIIPAYQKKFIDKVLAHLYDSKDKHRCSLPFI